MTKEDAEAVEERRRAREEELEAERERDLKERRIAAKVAELRRLRLWVEETAAPWWLVVKHIKERSEELLDEL